MKQRNEHLAATRRRAQRNNSEAARLNVASRRYFKQCQAYVYANATPTHAVERALTHLIGQLRRAEQRQLKPERFLRAQPDAYARALLRRTHAERPLDQPRYLIGTTLVFLGGVFLPYSLVLAVRGGLFYGTLAAAISAPLPISLLGLPLEMALAVMFLLMLARFLYESAFGMDWKRPKNLALLGLLVLVAVFFILTPIFSLSYQVFIIQLPVWLIWLIAAICFAVRFLQRHPLGIARRIEAWIEKRARQTDANADKN